MPDNDRSPEKSSLKDEIIGLIKHDEVDALFKRYLRHVKKVHRMKLIINSIVILLGFLIGIGAFYEAYQASVEQTEIATKTELDRDLSTDLQAKIDRKMRWMQKINGAVINMRKVRYHITLQCKYNKPISAYEQKVKRFNARYKLVLLATGNQFIFNKNLNMKIHQLVAFDESVKNVCLKNAPKDNQWQKYSIEINNIMGDSIKKEQIKLRNLGKN